MLRPLIEHFKAKERDAPDPLDNRNNNLDQSIERHSQAFHRNSQNESIHTDRYNAATIDSSHGLVTGCENRQFEPSVSNVGKTTSSPATHRTRENKTCCSGNCAFCFVKGICTQTVQQMQPCQVNPVKRTLRTRGKETYPHTQIIKPVLTSVKTEGKYSLRKRPANVHNRATCKRGDIFLKNQPNRPENRQVKKILNSQTDRYFDCDHLHRETTEQKSNINRKFCTAVSNEAPTQNLGFGNKVGNFASIRGVKMGNNVSQFSLCENSVSTSTTTQGKTSGSFSYTKFLEIRGSESLASRLQVIQRHKQAQRQTLNPYKDSELPCRATVSDLLRIRLEEFDGGRKMFRVGNYHHQQDERRSSDWVCQNPQYNDFIPPSEGGFDAQGYDQLNQNLEFLPMGYY